MTPNNDGEIIRLNIPQLTEDRRKDVAKEAKAVGEEAKVAVRSTRKKANDSVKKKGKDLSEDVAKDAQDQIQKLTDKLVKEIDALVAKKEKEVELDPAMEKALRKAEKKVLAAYDNQKKAPRPKKGALVDRRITFHSRLSLIHI